MTHERRIDRLHPALFVVLVDQSESMVEGLAGDAVPKMQAVTDQINTLLYELVLRCVKTPREPPRPYFHVALVGYSTGPTGTPMIELLLPPGLPGPDGLASITDIAQRPLRIAQRVDPGSGASVNAPVWVEPVARGGTPMCAALDTAGRVAARWVEAHPAAFPPIVLNLTDGEATDGDPQVWAERLRGLRSQDGGVLLFNISLSATPAPPSLFPSAVDQLPDRFARQLFAMSSPLPDAMLQSARTMGLPVGPGARGFAYNADIRSLALFLNIGTSVGRLR